MANENGRIYIPREIAVAIVGDLDRARLAVQRNASQENIIQLCSVAQWITHTHWFLGIHQELWKQYKEEGIV
jgi:hypothetical protein